MRIALFSDIHANLPALEACLASIDAVAPDAVYCLGDLVGYNVWPNEVVREIRKRNIPTLKGNYDEGIGKGIDECGCAYKTDAEKEMGKLSIAYTNSVVLPEERAYLRDLPAHIRLEFSWNDVSLNLLLVHGSPRRINEYLFEDREEKSLLRIMEEANAHVLCYGHTHKPYHRILRADTAPRSRYLHAINIGSVGKPKDGHPEGCYVLLTLNATTNLHDPGSIGVDFIRFRYDIEKAATAIEASPLPSAYADMLAKEYDVQTILTF